jgi:hypothetical protein
MLGRVIATRARLSDGFEKAGRNQVEVRSYLVPFTQSDLPFLDLYERCAIQQLDPPANRMKYSSYDQARRFWRMVAEKVVAEHPTLGPVVEQIAQIERRCEPWEELGMILTWLNKQVVSLPPELEQRSARHQQKERERQEQARRRAEQESEKQKVAMEAARRQAHRDLRQKIMTRVWLKVLGIWYAIVFLIVLILVIREPAHQQQGDFLALPFTSLLLAGMGLIFAGPVIHVQAEAIAEKLAGKEFDSRT